MPSNLEEEESFETRETSEQDPEKAPKKTQSKHFNWSSTAKQENSGKILTFSPRHLFSPDGPRRCHRIRETQLGRTLEKPENGLRRWIADFTKETGESIKQNEKQERFAGSDPSRCFESIASGMSGKTGEIVVDDVLGYVLPGRLAVFFDGNGSYSGG